MLHSGTNYDLSIMAKQLLKILKNELNFLGENAKLFVKFSR